MKKQIRFGIHLLVAVMFALFATGCSKTYRGLVLDADTRQPLEGVVVIVTWSEETTTVGATHTNLKLAKEVLTDKEGRWQVKGPRGASGEFMENFMAIFTLVTGTWYTLAPNKALFKPGYCSYPDSTIIESCRERMKYYDDIVELPRLTDASRDAYLNNEPVLPTGAKQDLPLYRRALDELELIRRNAGE
jgi:hypothetical protein